MKTESKKDQFHKKYNSVCCHLHCSTVIKLTAARFQRWGIILEDSLKICSNFSKPSTFSCIRYSWTLRISIFLSMIYEFILLCLNWIKSLCFTSFFYFLFICRLRNQSRRFPLKVKSFWKFVKTSVKCSTVAWTQMLCTYAQATVCFCTIQDLIWNHYNAGNIFFVRLPY